jgi:hypothetical protein
MIEIAFQSMFLPLLSVTVKNSLLGFIESIPSSCVIQATMSALFLLFGSLRVFERSYQLPCKTAFLARFLALGSKECFLLVCSAWQCGSALVWCALKANHQGVTTDILC